MVNDTIKEEMAVKILKGIEDIKKGKYEIIDDVLENKLKIYELAKKKRKLETELVLVIEELDNLIISETKKDLEV